MRSEVENELLPEAVRREVARVVGEVVGVEGLGGLSGSSVRRVRGRRRSAVLKGGVKGAEVEFYREVGSLLAGIGVTAPEVYWAGEVDGERWLVLEDVPGALPRERWGADPEVFGVLARLHAADGLPGLRARDAYRPRWTAETNAAAMGAFAPEDAAEMGSVFEELRVTAGHLFEPLAPLSGDANPHNWGVRADGTLVLFDWERFCRGHMALDLVTPLPGLGTLAEYVEAAEGYLSLRVGAGLPWSAAELGRDIGLAKAWIVVEFMAGVAAGETVDGPAAEWLRSAVPDWVRTVGRAIR